MKMVYYLELDKRQPSDKKIKLYLTLCCVFNILKSLIYSDPERIEDIEMKTNRNEIDCTRIARIKCEEMGFSVKMLAGNVYYTQLIDRYRYFSRWKMCVQLSD